MKTKDLSAAVSIWYAHSDDIEWALNKADSAIGDGDTGSMLVRVIKAIYEESVDKYEDLSKAFAAMAQATLSATGSSLGTLTATALMTFAKELKGRSNITSQDFAETLTSAIKAMEARGKASQGDKTVLDALQAVVAALYTVDPEGSPISSVQSSVNAALDHFRSQPCKIGRARMYGDSSVGRDDPGMYAVKMTVDLLEENFS